MTILIEESTIQKWLYQGKNKKAGNIFYSNLAIRLCLSLRRIFHLPLRQTEGFIASLFELMKISLPVPNYTTLSRRTSSLNLKNRFYHASNIQKDKILIIDSTGLSMYEAGEWEKRKRGYNRHKMWRKLHIVIDGNTQQVEMCQLTPNSTTDADTVKPLLEKKAKKEQKLIADRRYDQFKVYDFLDQKGIIPVINPTRNAVEHNREGPAHKARNKAIRNSKYTL